MMRVRERDRDETFTKNIYNVGTYLRYGVIVTIVIREKKKLLWEKGFFAAAVMTYGGRSRDGKVVGRIATHHFAQLEHGEAAV